MPMGIDWSHLPEEVKKAVCLCSRGKQDGGWRLDTTTGYWVHPKCGKPSILVGVEQCDTCSSVFVPKFYSKIQNSFLGIECDKCDPPNRVKRGKLN